MLGLGRQAAVLTFARLANYGLMFISPIFLVRILSVEQFGRYREFMLYASVLQWMAAFSINDSLLYFVPRYAQSPWRILRQTILLTAASSSIVVAVIAVLDLALKGALLGPFRGAVAIYVMLFVNFDFWESYFVASHRPAAVLAYSAGRLGLRMLTIVGVALVTSNVTTIIWSLMTFEAIRLLASVITWRLKDQSNAEPRLPGAWLDQLRFCIPTGLAVLLVMANRNLSNLAVAKVYGAVALAHYTIGTYTEPVLGALLSSVSSVLLPEMVRRRAQSTQISLQLWQHACVINCLMIFPTVVLLARYAELLITVVFGPSYKAAVPVFQIFLLVIVRTCFDFTSPLRAANDTRPMIYCNIIALAVTAVGLAVLMPLAGLTGAVSAFALSSLVEPIYLGICATRLYEIPAQQILPWKTIGKIAGAAIAAGAVIFNSGWSTLLGPKLGFLVAAIVYYVIFALAIKMLNIAEVATLLERTRNSLLRVTRARS